MQFHPSKQQPYKISALSVLSVDKKWVVGVSPPQVFSCGSWLIKSFFPEHFEELLFVYYGDSQFRGLFRFSGTGIFAGN